MLREKYGQGYRVNVNMTNTSSVEDVHIYMSTNFNASKFIESKHNWMKYTVQGKISSLLGLLAMAKSLNIIDSFTIAPWRTFSFKSLMQVPLNWGITKRCQKKPSLAGKWRESHQRRMTGYPKLPTTSHRLLNKLVYCFKLFL